MHQCYYYCDLILQGQMPGETLQLLGSLFIGSLHFISHFHRDTEHRGSSKLTTLRSQELRDQHVEADACEQII